MKSVVALVIFGFLAFPLTVLGQPDEVCLTLPTDPYANDDDQPRLVGVSLHLSLVELGQESSNKFMSFQCRSQNDESDAVIEELQAENKALEAEIQQLREDLRVILSNQQPGLPTKCIFRAQCDWEKEQLRAEMAADQAACEAVIQHMSEMVKASQTELRACREELAHMPSVCRLTGRCITFSEPPPSVCEPYLEDIVHCRGG